MTVRVAHMTSVHPADDVRILVKECGSLAAAGYEVVLVAPGEPRPASGGVHFVAVRRPRNRLERATRTAWAVYRASIRQAPHIYHFHDPELIPVALLLKLRRKRVIYDVHEDLPLQILGKDWIPASLRRPAAGLAAAAEFVAGRLVDAIVTVTPTIAARFPSPNTILVRNFPIVDSSPSLPLATPYMSRQPLVAYVGSLTAPRGAMEMVAAMSKVSARHAPRLVLAGRPHPETLKADLARTPGWDRVDMVGWLGRVEVAELLGRARIGIVTLLPLPNYRDSYPTKLFEYMAAGLPVIASDFPVWREIVASTGCGLLVDPADPQAIASAIDRLLDDPMEAREMGERGRAAAQTSYSWSTERDALLRLYDRLLRR